MTSSEIIEILRTMNIELIMLENLEWFYLKPLKIPRTLLTYNKK